jgi:hypothetical protein
MPIEGTMVAAATTLETQEVTESFDKKAQSLARRQNLPEIQTFADASIGLLMHRSSSA